MTIVRQIVPQHSRGRAGEELQHIVLHYSVSGGSARDVANYFLANPHRQASYHYIIDRRGDVVQCVHTKDTAWHASGRAPGDRKVVPRRNNRRSIGICLVNWGYSGPEEVRSVGPLRPVRGGRKRMWQAYTEAQYQQLRALIRVLQRQHPTLQGVCGHEDNAAKADPGPAFDWGRLVGLGLTRHTYRRSGWAAQDLDSRFRSGRWWGSWWGRWWGS